MTLTTICETDLHIVRGEHAVKPGLVIGHEPVGVIAELGLGVTGYQIGDRLLVGAITPCGQCRACLSGHLSQCGHGGSYEALGGWRFGNTINGARFGGSARGNHPPGGSRGHRLANLTTPTYASIT